MEVRSSHRASRADIADDLALFDAAAGSNATPERAQMGIGRLVLGVVANFDEFTQSTLAAAKDKASIAGSVDWCSGCGGEVDAPMHAGVIEDWMEPSAIA